MDPRLVELLTSLRASKDALDAEVQPLLQALAPDWSMLERLRDVADEFAGRARRLRHAMAESGGDPDALGEVDRLCTHFDRTAALIAQKSGAADNALWTEREARQGHG